MGYSRPTTSEAGPDAHRSNFKTRHKECTRQNNFSRDAELYIAISDTPGLITDDAKVDMQVNIAKLPAM